MNITDFENKWFQKIKDDLLKSFPEDFIETSNFEFINLPGKPLLKGSELFGTYEIIDTDGITLLSTANLFKIKYILYANRENQTKIKIITDEKDLSNTVKRYEKHLDELLKKIIHDFKSEFPNSDKLSLVSNKIFQLLNLRRY